MTSWRSECFALADRTRIRSAYFSIRAQLPYQFLTLCAQSKMLKNLCPHVPTVRYLVSPNSRTPAAPHAASAANTRTPPTTSSWTVPQGQPPPPDCPPPHECALSSRSRSPPQQTPPREMERSNVTRRPPPPLTPPPPLHHRRRVPPATTTATGMKLPNTMFAPGSTTCISTTPTNSPSPSHGRRYAANQGAGNGVHGVALWPSQTLPPPANIASVGPPPMLPPQLQPQLVPTTSSTAPAAPAVLHPRQQVFAPPVFTPRPYAQAGPATAAATATPAAMTRILQGGVVLAAPSAVAAVPATPAGTHPAAVTLPLGSVARPPAVITTGPSRPGPAARTGGPPLFTPQELDAAAAAVRINQARATLAMRRENPAAAGPATTPAAYLPENHPHPGGQPFHLARHPSRERLGSNDGDGSPRQHQQHQGPSPPPFHPWS